MGRFEKSGFLLMNDKNDFPRTCTVIVHTLVINHPPSCKKSQANFRALRVSWASKENKQGVTWLTGCGKAPQWGIGWKEIAKPSVAWEESSTGFPCYFLQQTRLFHFALCPSGDPVATQCIWHKFQELSYFIKLNKCHLNRFCILRNVLFTQEHYMKSQKKRMNVKL